MTTRHAGYVVVLDDDVREDDAEHVINALRMVRGVVAVTPIVADATAEVATTRERVRLRDAVLAALDPVLWNTGRREAPR